MPLELKVQNLDNIVKKRIGNASHQYGNGIGFNSF